MIDPTSITKFDRSTQELEEFIIFCVAVAGHKASTTAKCLDNLYKAVCEWLHADEDTLSFFEMFRVFYFKHINIVRALKEYGIGNYNLKAESFLTLAFSQINLETCSTELLEHMPGIGPKTSRYFVLHSRKNANCIPIDRHWLKFFQENGYNLKSVPTGNKYLEYEQIALDFAKKSGKSVAEFDLNLWNEYSGSDVHDSQS